MKTFLVLCLVCVVCAEDVPLSAAQKQIVNQLSEDCITSSGVDASLVDEAKKGIYKEDDKLDEFVFCFLSKLGIVDAQGELVVENALAKLPPGIDKASAAQVLNECKDQSGPDAVHTSAKILRCYHDKTNQHVLYQL